MPVFNHEKAKSHVLLRSDDVCVLLCLIAPNEIHSAMHPMVTVFLCCNITT